jgi:ribose 5-phosphate isomerase A
MVSAMNDPYQPGKRAAARAAADLVRSGMRVGFGTGTTFRHVLERLAERIAAEGLDVVGVPTSEATAGAARALGVPLGSLDEIEALDLAIDGADEVDRRKNLIKGGGGALLREKIVAAAARELVVVVSDNKLVERLGETFALPVEVVPFGWRRTAAALEALGARVTLRCGADGEPFVTDGAHRILDCALPPIDDPAALERCIDAIPGVVESGLFVGMAGRVLVGAADGSVRVIP